MIHRLKIGNQKTTKIPYTSQDTALLGRANRKFSIRHWHRLSFHVPNM